MASAPTAHGGSSSAAAKKTIRLGWNEKLAGANTSKRFPAAQSPSASASRNGSSGTSAPTACAAAMAATAIPTVAGMKSRAERGSSRYVGARLVVTFAQPSAGGGRDLTTGDRLTARYSGVT